MNNLKILADHLHFKRKPFREWLYEVSPTWQWDWPHVRLVIDYLTRLRRIKRLMVFEPPRHGKTELITIRYPVWRLEYEPSLRVIVGAYNQLLANEISRSARRIARSRFQLAEPQTVSEWSTASGGSYRAVGVGSGVTGHGADLIIVDDPIKSREEANSQAYRDRVWDWFTNDLYTRLEPGGAICLVQTRWHEDDLAGRLLKTTEGWTVIRLPAIAEEGDILGREPGEALCPARYTVEDLRRIESVIGSLSFAALYQQRPVPLEGNLAKREWFDIVDFAPSAPVRVRAWDLASTEKETGDFVVGTLASMYKGRFYVESVIRGRWRPSETEEKIKQTAAIDGKKTTIVFEQEPSAGAKMFCRYLASLLHGYNVKFIRPVGDKVSRGVEFLAQAEAGNVLLLRGAWNEAWLDEICSVPLSTHDDQWDSVTLAYRYLTRERGWAKGYE